MRSGNHAVIEWILAQYAGRPACFLNNVQHGDRDPYASCGRKVLQGIDPDTGLEDLRRLPKALLVYSYEDRRDAERPGLDFIDSVFDPVFEARREQYLGGSAASFDLMVLRDPFNCIASRMQLLATRGALGGSEDIALVMDNWKRLARRAVALQDNPVPGSLVVNYNRWARDRAYRQQLAATLGGQFSDASMQRMSSFGGGSSFDVQPLTLAELPAKWRRLFRLRNWRRPLHVYRRLTAPQPQGRIDERWRAFREHPVFRDLMGDEEVLRLSERLFGELPDTREFVAGLAVTSGAT